MCDDVIVCDEEGTGHTHDVIGVIAAASVPVLSGIGRTEVIEYREFSKVVLLYYVYTFLYINLWKLDDH